MNTAHSWRRTYVVFGASQGSGSPLIDRCRTIESDGQRRQGRGVLIRLPFCGGRPTRGLVVGIWDRPGSAGAVVMGGMEERR
jgi:hypothetical protein